MFLLLLMFKLKVKNNKLDHMDIWPIGEKNYILRVDLAHSLVLYANNKLRYLLYCRHSPIFLADF